MNGPMSCSYPQSMVDQGPKYDSQVTKRRKKKKKKK
jgi:hypothetical protein